MIGHAVAVFEAGARMAGQQLEQYRVGDEALAVEQAGFGNEALVAGVDAEVAHAVGQGEIPAVEVGGDVRRQGIENAEQRGILRAAEVALDVADDLAAGAPDRLRPRNIGNQQRRRRAGHPKQERAAVVQDTVVDQLREDAAAERASGLATGSLQIRDLALFGLRQQSEHMETLTLPAPGIEHFGDAARGQFVEHLHGHDDSPFLCCRQPVRRCSEGIDT